jgi:hypothetical protein
VKETEKFFCVCNVYIPRPGINSLQNDKTIWKLCTSFEVQHVINTVAYLPPSRTVEPQEPPFASNARTNNGTRGLCNPLLDNGSVNTVPRRRNDLTSTVLSYHVTCFLCGLRHTTVELCFLYVRAAAI